VQSTPSKTHFPAFDSIIGSTFWEATGNLQTAEWHAKQSTEFDAMLLLNYTKAALEKSSVPSISCVTQCVADDSTQ